MTEAQALELLANNAQLIEGIYVLGLCLLFALGYQSGSTR